MIFATFSYFDRDGFQYFGIQVAGCVIPRTNARSVPLHERSASENLLGIESVLNKSGMRTPAGGPNAGLSILF